MALSRHVSSFHAISNIRVQRHAKTGFIQIDADKIIEQLRQDPEKSWKEHILSKSAISSVTPYSTRYASKESIPKFRIPDEGTPAEAASQLLRDELDLDGKPNLNLAR
jgi:glutamate decarboxylase